MMNNADKKHIIEIMKIIIGIDDIEIIKCALESLIETLEDSNIEDHNDNLSNRATNEKTFARRD